MQTLIQLPGSLLQAPTLRPALVATALALLVCLGALVAVTRRALALSRPSDRTTAGDGESPLRKPAGLRIWPEWAAGLSLLAALAAPVIAIEDSRHGMLLALQSPSPSEKADLLALAFSGQVNGLALAALALLVMLPLAVLISAMNWTIRVRAEGLAPASEADQSVETEPSGRQRWDFLRQPILLGLGAGTAVVFAVWSALTGVLAYSIALAETYSVVNGSDPFLRAKLAAQGATLAETDLAAKLTQGSIVGLAIAAALAVVTLRLGTTYRRRCPTERARDTASSSFGTLAPAALTLAAAAACLIAARPYAAERRLPLLRATSADILLPPSMARDLPAQNGPDGPEPVAVLALGPDGMWFDDDDVADLPQLRARLTKHVARHDRVAHLGHAESGGRALNVAASRDLPLPRLLDALGAVRAAGIQTVYLLFDRPETQHRPILGRQTRSKITAATLALASQDRLAPQSVKVPLGGRDSPRDRLRGLGAGAPVALAPTGAAANVADLARLAAQARQGGHRVQLILPPNQPPPPGSPPS